MFPEGLWLDGAVIWWFAGRIRTGVWVPQLAGGCQADVGRCQAVVTELQRSLLVGGDTKLLIRVVRFDPGGSVRFGSVWFGLVRFGSGDEAGYAEFVASFRPWQHSQRVRGRKVPAEYTPSAHYGRDMSGANYYSTFIGVADDCRAGIGVEPPVKAKPTVARLQFEMVMESPYEFTSEDVIFAASGAGQAVAGLSFKERSEAQAAFFAKPQACMRASPLPKQYGWGVHSDSQGRVALVPAGSAEYTRFADDADIKQLKALRSKGA